MSIDSHASTNPPAGSPGHSPAVQTTEARAHDIRTRYSQRERAEAAARFADLTASGKCLEPEIEILVDSLIRLLLARHDDDGWEAIGRLSSDVTAVHNRATEAVKVLRSDAVDSLHLEGRTWEALEPIFGVKKARLDQIRKGVSGGRYQRQKHADRR
ncbi:hypothetical protein [Nocardioides sp. Leaf285]|uniref:hypothetical protein n=1 Tax=Nocardioides sp. Leaf285 TaxID=1736322 RepID=UPI0007036B3F|nr:hypothetical protein [Nocardioides sp. Leaf285]KQP62897.1 hypothetical protein ASF47_17955 [Nocardioides sp. Leaf285]